MRVLRPGGAHAASPDHQARARALEPAPRRRGPRAADVRWPDEPGASDPKRGAPLLPGRDLQHGDPAQRAPLGGTELREARDAPCPEIEWVGRISRTHRGGAEA